MSNDSNSTSSAASCANGHVFFFAGDISMMQDGYPCACGMTKYRASSDDAYKFCAGCKQPLPTHMGPHGETTSGIFIINKKDIRFERTPGAIVTHNDGPRHSVFCAKCASEKASATTNDPQTAYGKKREPMLSDEDARWGAFADQGQNERGADRPLRDEHSWRHGWRSATWSLEALIASGELIVKSELVEWLEAMAHELDELGDRADTTNMAAPYDWKYEAVNEVIDHINKKV